LAPASAANSKAVPMATLGSPFSALIRVARLIPARSANSVCVQRRARRRFQPDRERLTMDLDRTQARSALLPKRIVSEDGEDEDF
jgi:hypothetical protein